MKQNKENCEKMQLTMLETPSSAWPAAVSTHLAGCRDCAAFAKTLELAEGARGEATPPVALDQAVLRLARTRQHIAPARTLAFPPQFVKASWLAAAAMLVAALMLVAVYTRQPAAPRISAAELPAWEDTELQEELLLAASSMEFALLSRADTGTDTTDGSGPSIMSDILLEGSALELILGTDSEANGT